MVVDNVLHRSVSGGAPLWFKVVGPVHADWEGAGWISPSGDAEDERSDITSKWV